MSTTGLASADQGLSTPYVGLRPFTREDRAWFFGRDRDAGLLFDKILSSRLTLLYALSGVGKSSLLRALVTPRLEADECRVLYFDDWAGSNPLAALKEAIAVAAVAAGMTDPRSGSPTLAELCGLVAADGKTFVLLLDQFEEFLINHGNELDPLRKELGALVKARFVDARVLIALREEYLAALEPFRQEILTFFQSTYRLDSLDPEGARQAIVGPADVAGGEVEPALADRLMDDLQYDRRTPDPRAAIEASRSKGTAFWIDRLVNGIDWLVNAWPWRRAEADPGTTVIVQSAGQAVSSEIDLPTLQVVCEQLWDAAPVLEGRRRLTLALYADALHGKEAILETHFRSKMPAGRKSQILTARLMKFLAPSSGLKISYSAGDLASMAGLDRGLVKAELNRLAAGNVRILRARKVGGHARYELLHDAQIRYIVPWRDEVLRSAAIRRISIRIAAVPLAAVALVVVAWGYHQISLRQEIASAFTELRQVPASNRSREEAQQKATTTFDNVANRLLSVERGAGHLRLLRDVLEKNQDLLPEDYAGERDPGWYSFNPSDPRFALRVRQGRKFDRASFGRTWSEISRANSAKLGFNLQRPRLDFDPDFSRERFEFAGTREAVLVPLQWPDLGGKYLVSMAKIPPDADEFLKQFGKEWTSLGELGRDQWYAVPPWSLPVWKAARLRIESESAYIALALGEYFSSHPEKVLTQTAVRDLVQRVSRRYPCTAAEVLKVRGPTLPQDLIDWSQRHQDRLPVSQLQLLFDQLSVSADGKHASSAAPETSHPYFDSASAAQASDWVSGGLTDVPCKPATANPDSRGRSGAYLDVGVAELAPKLRVELGPELLHSLAIERRPLAIKTGGSDSAQSNIENEAATAIRRGAARGEGRAGAAIRPAARAEHLEDLDIGPLLAEAIELNRRETYRRFGLWTPFPTFERSVEPAGGSFEAYRVAVLDQSLDRSIADAGTSDRERIQRLIGDLNSIVEPATSAWIDAEFVGALLSEGDLSPNVSKELAKTLSITNFKLLLRTTLAAETDGATKTATVRTPVAWIPDPPWLLESLLFWEEYWPERPSLAEVALQLRQLEQRRLAGRSRVTAPGASDLIDRALEELEADHVDKAQQLFKQALNSSDRRRVAEIFMDRYAARWPQNVLARVRPFCKDAVAGGMKNARLQVQIDNLWRAADVPGMQRDIALCLLSSVPDSMPDYKAKLQLEIAQRYEKAEWDAKSAVWLGLQMLRRFDPMRDPDRTSLDRGEKLLIDGVRRANPKLAEETVADLIGFCKEPGPKNWCWKVVPEVVAGNTDPWIALDYALEMSTRRRPEEARTAFDWLASANDRFARQPSDPVSRDRFKFFSTFANTQAHYKIGLNGNRPDLEEAQRLLSQELSGWGERAPNLAMLLDLELELARFGSQPNPESATKITELERKKFQNSSGAWSDSVMVSLESGDGERLKSLMKELQTLLSSNQIPDDELTGFWFVVSVAGFMSDPPPEELDMFARRFIRTDHPYAPLVAMLLHSEMVGITRNETEDLMKARWQRAKAGRASRDERLRAGDARPWYDLLLGLYLGQVPPSEIFDPLRNDAAFAASPFARLPFTRRDMQTEAWFYSALRSFATGRSDDALANLHHVIEDGNKEYIECGMARRVLSLGRLPRSTSGLAPAKAPAS